MVERSQLPIAEGTTLGGRYRVGRELGRGGMGAVFEAQHLTLDEPVAVKVLLSGSARGPQAAARFVREARTVMRLRSEHAVRVLDVGVEGELAYMVMELLEGGDLQSLVRQRGPLPAEEAAGYVLQACEALAEAHAQGIVHRDIKPANLFVTRRFDGSPLLKVLDFGVAKVLEPQPTEPSSLTASSVSVGSPLYMAPEQIRSAKNVDSRADIWSLGIVLYELTSGQLPYTADDVQGLLAAIVSEEPRPLGAVRPDIDPAFEAVIVRCLRRSRDHRFASVVELAQALSPFAPPWARASLEQIKHAPPAQPAATPRAGAPIDPLAHTQGARTEEAPRPGAETVPNVTLAASDDSPPPTAPPRPRRRWLLPTAGAGLLVIGGLQVAFMGRSADNTQPLLVAAPPSADAKPATSEPVALPQVIPVATPIPSPTVSVPAAPASVSASPAGHHPASTPALSTSAPAPARGDKVAAQGPGRAPPTTSKRIEQAIDSRE